MSTDISVMNVMKDLVEIKGMIDKSTDFYSREETASQKIKELEKKIADVSQPFQTKDCKKQHPESPVKIKTKKEIIKLLEQHKRLTSTQLSMIKGISRTRSNEYLRELEEQGIAEGLVIKKKKFYRLVKWPR